VPLGSVRITVNLPLLISCLTHGVVTLHLFEQLPTLLLNAGRETTRRLVPLRTACPLMCIPDRLSPVIWTISSIRSKGSSGKFQSWFWTSG
jgi:hypothetical protein